jgi:CBS domain containing-hemolysin-like protein
VTLTVTDDTLRDWVENEQPESTLEKGEREMIYSIFRFGETMAKEVMVPRMDVLALEVNTTISDARHEFIKAGHSRVPVYEDSIDNVIGMLYAKDLLAVVDGNDTIAAQRQLLRPAYFVPEAKKVDELLAEMQSRGVHMVLVVDEYADTLGGFIYGQLGRVPQPGEVVIDKDFEFTVEQVVARRIIKVKVRRLGEDASQKDNENGNTGK